MLSPTFAASPGPGCPHTSLTRREATATTATCARERLSVAEVENDVLSREVDDQADEAGTPK